MRYWPLPPGHVVTSPFGPRSGTIHLGTDFGRPGGSAGMAVYAVQSGTVIHAGAASGYGGPDPAGWLVIDSSDDEGGGCVEYGHIVREVGLGDHVAAGQRIGRINPDSSTNGGVAPHLHLSVMPLGYDPNAKFDPVPWLADTQFPGDDMPSPRYSETTQWTPNRHARNPKGIRWFVLHTQEGYGTAASLANYLCRPASEVSYHYVVDNAGDVVDVVDTDDASWSVGDANDQTINLCFAGSFTRWTRQEWIDRMRHGIRVAAHLAAADCRKYRLDPRIVSIDDIRHGASGITDHNGINKGLNAGDHTDVGPGFPWDLFVADLHQKPEEGFMTALTETEQRELLDGVRYIRGQLGPWSQLGLNDKGEPLTLVDAVAELKARP